MLQRCLVLPQMAMEPRSYGSDENKKKILDLMLDENSPVSSIS